MKLLRLLSVLLLTQLLSLTTNAQLSGEITYSETVKMNINIEGSSGIDLSEFMPPSRSTTQLLSFQDQISTYKLLENNNEDIGMGSDDGTIKIVILDSDIEKILYINQNTKTRIEQKGFMGKAFVVEETLEKIKWKITGEKVKYLGYECIKAVSTNEEGELITAWFAPSIPTSIGPSKYGQLPGAIVMLSKGDDDVVIKATKVELKTIDQLKKPTKGKKVTTEEYDQIIEEKMKEMAQQYGGSGIRIRG